MSFSANFGSFDSLNVRMRCGASWWASRIRCTERRLTPAAFASIRPVQCVVSPGGGTFAREDFDYNQEADIYVCPAGKVLTSTGTLVNDGATLLYRASKYDCDGCELKLRCCPKMPARKVPRSIYENARDVARDIAKTEAYVTSRRERKKIEACASTNSG